ncbi:MAG: GC-type dockerin domain-anchored protein [Phycisphaerales bacterium]
MRRTITMLTTLLLAAGIARADWPTDPSGPLFVGPLTNAFNERAGILPGADGSVWLAWQEAYCIGEFLLQRVSIDGDLLAPMGIAIQEDPSCGFHLVPAMAVIGDSIVATRRLSSLQETPVQRYSSAGSALWFPPFSHPAPLAVEVVAGIGEGDALIVSQGWDTVHVDRIDPSGDPVWDEQLVFNAPGGANFDIVSFVPDAAGGGYVFWEAPAGYVRTMHAMRITGDGQAAWETPVAVVSTLLPHRGVSRHTHSEMVPDGQGGAVVVYTEGFEQGSTPADLFMQRILPDGSLAFPMPGVRVSLSDERQFDVDLESDPVSGDMLITWRHGLFDAQWVYAQRMSISGDRLWGEDGIELSALDVSTGSFDSVWNDGKLKTGVGSPEGVSLVQADATGLTDPNPVLVGSGGPADFVKIAASGDGVVVSWQVDGASPEGMLVAQRVNRAGQLGGPALCPADLNGDRSLDFFDVSAFLSAFIGQDPIADFTGDGEWNFFDISAFLGEFSTGCP